MGAQAILAQDQHSSPSVRRAAPFSRHEMAPMKAMKTASKAMSKGALAEALAGECELKKNVCAKLISSLSTIATSQVTKAGVFMLPGLVRIKTRTKPATKAGKREIFGKMVVVKAKPARKIVKAFPLAALKRSV